MKLAQPLHDYYLSIMQPEHPVMQQLRLSIANQPIANFQSSPEQAALLQFLVGLIGAENALELGTFMGYSAMAIALALPDQGKLISCDINAEWSQIAQQHWQQANVQQKIDHRLQPALALLENLQGPFDFIFIDADKRNYPTYYEKSLPLLRTGGLMVIDNVFWHGKVADEAVNDSQTKAIRELNDRLKNDKRIALSTIPIADGMSLIRKL